MKKVIALFMLVILGGCASVKVSLYDKNIRYPATEPSQIEIFQKKPQGQSFIEIGEITVEGASGWTQIERIFKIKAAEYGGDAVYVYTSRVQDRTYVYPHGCHYYGGYFYPHGYHRNPYYARYPYHRGYFPRYYYCYGYEDVETVEFITAVGVVIKYN